MAGSLTVPTVLASLGGGQQNLTLIDANFSAITGYVNVRELTIGALAARPAAQYAGRYYFASDQQGGTLYEDTGIGWQQIAPGLTQVIAGSAPQVLVGLTLSNDVGAPNTTLDVAAGAASSDDATIANRILMTLGSAITGTTAGTWVVGTGQPKLDAGAVGADTWYHVFLIERVDTSAVDMLFSTSASAPTMPASYTKRRRIGSFRTDGSSNILAFTQVGDRFTWTATVLEVSATNPGVAAVTVALGRVPTGVQVVARCLIGAQNNGVADDVFALFSPLAATDETPGGTNSDIPPVKNATGRVIIALTPKDIQTTTGAGVRYRLSFSDGDVLAYLRVTGWNDRRGQDA